MNAGAQREPDFDGPDKNEWQRLKPVLEKCRNLPPEEWDAVLRMDLAADSALMAAALKFLAANRAAAEAETIPESIAAKLADQVVGDKFRLHRIIGRPSGCGVVYEASRIEPIQQVAVKILKPELLHGDVKSRFEREARILSSMHHPNIVQFLDWGEVRGLPYFVMEFVEGQPVDEYCRNRKLPLRDRLKLFQDMCSGVQYAHNHEIVHRDLKPENILVSDEFGQVKLLDFGVAKIMEPPMWDCEPLTRTGFQPKTRAWASPEQLKDQRVTAASDIYSLGLLLLQLLTGRSSEPDRNQAPSSLITANLAAQMQEPDVASLVRKVRGDLDSIIAKATAANPKDRYDSAGLFSDDIANYLNGKPVTAHPDTSPYRVRKFVGRHQVLVASVVFAFLALSIGLSTAWVEAVRAVKARNQAESLNKGMGQVVSHLDTVLQQIQRQQMEDLAEVYEGIAAELEHDMNYGAALKLWESVKKLSANLNNSAHLRTVNKQVERLATLVAGRGQIGAASGGIENLRLSDGVSPELLGEAFFTEGQILRSSGRPEEAATAFERARTVLAAAPASARQSELLRQLKLAPK